MYYNVLHSDFAIPLGKVNNMNNTFKDWFDNQYNAEEKRHIAEYGCSNGFSGLIYYSETNALYDQYAEELHCMVDDYCTDVGMELPDTILSSFGALTNFKNNMVWLGTEILANEFINMEGLA